MSRIKAVVFDMDGVLIDAKEWHYEALNRALNLFGYNISRHDHLVEFDGLPTKKKLEMLTKENGFPRMLHGFVNDLKQLYTVELVHSRCKPRFEHEYALAKLQADGYQLAVASNSIRHTVELMMAKSNLKHRLSQILSNQDVSNGKPDPEIYLAAMRLLGVSPAETLVVEDNEHGIAAAEAAGANILVVNDPTEVTYDRIMRRIKDLSKKS